MKMPMSAFVILLVILSASCMTEGARTPALGEIVVAEASYESLSAVAPEEVAIRCLDTAGWPTCDQLRPSAATLQGPSTLIVDRSSLFRLSGDGHVSRIGGTGDGPGELRAPIAIGVDPGDRVVVYDVRRARIIRYSADTLLDEQQLLPPRYMREMYMRSGDLFVFVLPPGATRGDSVSASVVRIRTDALGAMDTVATFRARSNAGAGDGATFTPRLPWEPTHIWDACPDGSIVVASTDHWRVSRYRMSGSAVAIVSRQNSAKPASAAERESVFAAWIERSPRVPAFREGLKARFPEMPNRPPMVDRIVCEGPDAALLRNYPLPSERSARWDRVHDSRGVTASYTLPSDAELVASDGQVGLLLRMNDDGPSLARLRWR